MRYKDYVCVLDADLRRAALAALDLERGRGRAYAEQFPWDRSCERFLSHLVPATAPARTGVPCSAD